MQVWRAARLTGQLDNIEVTLADKDVQLIKAQQVVMSSKQQTEILMFYNIVVENNGLSSLLCSLMSDINALKKYIYTL